MSTNPFTEEHELLRDSVQKFVAKEIIPNVEEWEKNEHCEKEVFKKMGEKGFFGVSFPEKYGGGGMDFWAAVVVIRELAYANIGGLSMSLYAHTYLPLPLLVALGTDDQKRDYLVPALAGEKIAALAITEPGAGSDVAGITTTAKDMGDHYLLNGSKMFTTNGNIADFVVVVAKTGEGMNITLLVVDTNTEGFSSIAVKNKLGMHSSDTAQLFFEDCKVPKTAVIGQEGHGFYYIMNNFQEERLLAGVTGMFVAEWALEKAKVYALERKAFGREIGKFQVIRHKIAQMAVKVEACRSIAYRAVAEFIEQGNKAEIIITMAKAFISEESMIVINDSLQIHGGVGYTEDYGIARAWRDARLLTIGAGTTEIMHEILGKVVLDEVQHTDKLGKSAVQV
ncbi:MAG TPA: acyl-CoA dehydrogenase [Flavobacteriales bacterium]|nr:acyl-CoA dehydrogenase [Flavobacteriales bacterium]HIO67163.1 acyl-CoA dehydrogenase [Flavobacteriales bacterium]